MATSDGFERIEPKVWQYNEGDQIEGVLIQKVKLGLKQSNAYYLENKEGKILVWGSAVLDDRLAVVEIGDILRITYKGKKPNAKGQQTKMFDVERKKVN